MRTTLTIDDDVAAKLRDEMAKSQRGLNEVVNAFLRRGLHAHSSVSDLAEPRRPTGCWGNDDHLATPFTVKARPMGLRQGFGLHDTGGVLEYLDGVSRRR